MPKVWTFTLAAAGFMAVTAGAAYADPCNAPLPTRAGAEFGGVVRYVGDGDSLCVGPANGDGSTWIEVRLMDFNAPEMREGAPARAAKAALERVAFGQEARCVVTRGESGTRSWDRTHAICTINGRRIGDLMREAGAPEGGN